MAIRFTVFSDEQGYAREIEVDDIDPECLHWVAVDEAGKGIGTARLYRYSPSVGKVGRVAVLQSTRGTGLGRQIMEAMERYVAEKELEIEMLVLSSQIPARPFYEKLGYEAVGDVYPDEGQPHIRMEKTISRKRLPLLLKKTSSTEMSADQGRSTPPQPQRGVFSATTATATISTAPIPTPLRHSGTESIDTETPARSNAHHHSDSEGTHVEL
ncbi:hypothetical protein BG004_007763 [Podila humilis]|nr:hypothetical protein BG004_007763 [Podila humilis]